MSKNKSLKYAYDDDEDYVPVKKMKYSVNENSCNKKHTLDSDEEDEVAEEKNNKIQAEALQNEDIDGQEDATVAFEGETVITPFNMKDEMEDGHFDKEGFYHFKKDSELIKDAWLDNIDWIKIKKNDEIKNKYGSGSESESDDTPSLPPSTQDRDEETRILIETYKQILTYVNPEENIAKALKRQGGNKKRITSADRWKLKKQGKLDEVCGQMKNFNKLTELVNEVVVSGNMDVYQETYEMIKLKIERYDSAKSKPVVDMFGSTDDMFSDNFPTNKQQKNDSSVKSDSRNVKFDVKDEEKDTFDETQWEYRLKNVEEAEIKGPYSTAVMIELSESGQFKEGFYTRKHKENGPWYHSSRVEFDLYV